MGKNINTTKKNTQASLVINKVAGLEICCMFSSSINRIRTKSQYKDS